MNKIYFVRPKPEFNFEDMPIFLIATDKPESVWNWIYSDTRSHKEDEYFIQEEFLPTKPTAEGIIWGNSKIVKGI